MSPRRRTVVLALSLAAIAALDLAVHLPEPPPERLSDLPAVPADIARTITITQATGRLVLQSDGEEGWLIASDRDHPADRTAVAALLAKFASPVPLEARVDEGVLEPYGLESGKSLRIAIDGTSGPLLDLYVGANGPAGTTFVRYPDDDVVYTARIGGRTALARPVEAWRDTRVTALEAWQVDRVVATAADGLAYELSRAEDHWTLQAPPDLPVLPGDLLALVEALCAIESTGIVPEGQWDTANAQWHVRLEPTAKETVELWLGRRAGGAVARLRGRPLTYATTPEAMERLAALPAPRSPHP